MRTLVEACPDTPVEFPGGKKPAWKQRSSPVPSPPEASPKRSRLLTRGWRFCGAGGRELLEPVESRAWVALVHLVLRDERHPMGLGLFPRGALEPVRTGRDWCTSGCWRARRRLSWSNELGRSPTTRADELGCLDGLRNATAQGGQGRWVIGGARNGDRATRCECSCAGVKGAQNGLVTPFRRSIGAS